MQKNKGNDRDKYYYETLHFQDSKIICQFIEISSWGFGDWGVTSAVLLFFFLILRSEKSWAPGPSVGLSEGKSNSMPVVGTKQEAGRGKSVILW